MTTLKCSGLRMTTARPTGDRASMSSNLTVTEIADWPGTRRRLRATEGCGGDSSRSTAAAYAVSAGTIPSGSDCSVSLKDAASCAGSTVTTASGT
jgi:hypothetical protein